MAVSENFYHNPNEDVYSFKPINDQVRSKKEKNYCTKGKAEKQHLIGKAGFILNSGKNYTCRCKYSEG